MKKFAYHPPDCRTLSLRAHSMGINAFTMVEMLVTTGLLTAVMLMLFTILQQSSEAWNGAEKRIDAFREARAALFMISRDLEAAHPITGRETFFLNKAGTGPVGNLADAPDAGHGDNLFFVVSLPANSQDPTKNRSDLCLVGYYLSWDAEPGRTGSQRVVNLRRFFRSSDETFTLLRDYFAGTSTTLFTPNVVGASADEIVARNVINLDFEPFSKTGTPAALTAATEAEKNAWDPEITPDAVEVGLIAFNYSVAKALVAKADWYLPKNWETANLNTVPFGDLKRRNARQFQTRVNLR